MALIEKRKGRNDGGYTRLFGNDLLGQLLSRVQSTVIASGSELERFVIEKSNTLDDLDAFLEMDVIPESVFVDHKKILKISKLINYVGVEQYFVIFEHRGKKHHFYLIELKDGDTFDTKKAAGEREGLHRFMNAISPSFNFRRQSMFASLIGRRESREGLTRAGA